LNKINDNKDGYYPDNGDSNNAEETYHDFDENGAKVENTGFRKAVVPDFKGPTNERQVSTLLNFFSFVADADYRRAPKVPHWGRRCSDNSSTGHSLTDNWSTGLAKETTRQPNIVSLIFSPVDQLSILLALSTSCQSTNVLSTSYHRTGVGSRQTRLDKRGSSLCGKVS
jgi:hypothetical protein